MNSRINGNNFELSLASDIMNTDANIKFYDKESETLFNRLQSKSKKCFNIVLPSILTRITIVKIKLHKDQDGIKGNSSDITVINSNNQHIGLSLKHENLSLKHPRPKSIMDRITDNNVIIKEYRAKYSQINEKWYGNMKNHYINFCEMTDKEKKSMYKEFTDLLLDFLTSHTELVKGLFRFCTCTLASEDTSYILQIRGNNVITYQYNRTIGNNVNFKRINDRTVEISYGSATLKFRIHNAKKNITKNLSLKYDVTCPDNSLYSEIDKTGVARLPSSVPPSQYARIESLRLVAEEIVAAPDQKETKKIKVIIKLRK